MKAFERFASKLSTFSAFLAGVAMFLMMVQVSFDVVLKYVFNWPIPMTLETVSSYYMVALVFLPLGIVTRDHEHISVELFTQGLNDKWMAFTNATAGVLASAYVVVMFYRSGQEAIHKTIIQESWETAILDMQVWPSRWFVPIGCALMTIYLLIHVIDNYSFFFRGRRIMTSGSVTSKLDLDL
jgi:TRAP-type C4-dicarboxylate transport system permease small subunit